MLRHACLRAIASALTVSAVAAPVAHGTANREAPYDPTPRAPVVVHHASGGSDPWPVIGVGAVAVLGTGLALRGRVHLGGRARGTRVAR